MLRLRSGTSFLTGIDRRILVRLQTRLSPHPNLHQRYNKAYRTGIEFAQSHPARLRADRSDKVETKASFGIPKQADPEKASVCKMTLYCACRPLPLKHQASRNDQQHERIRLIGSYLPEPH